MEAILFPIRVLTFLPRLLFSTLTFLPRLVLKFIYTFTIRPLVYVLRLLLSPSRWSFSTVQNILWFPVDLLLSYDTLLPLVALISFIGLVTGIILYALQNLLSQTLGLTPPAAHKRTPSTTSSPLSLSPLTPATRRRPKSIDLHSPISHSKSKTPSRTPLPATPTNYKAQMQDLMAERQTQLIAMHEEEKQKRRRMLELQAARRAAHPHAPSSPGTLLLSPKSPSFGGWEEAERRDSGHSIGGGLGVAWGTGVGMAMTTFSPGGQGAGFLGPTILEEEEDSDF